ncbi:MAG: asparaginase [Lachnospiraceae bacterium]|nr:asparaginase [Lachnospiraceae bacterium]
MSFRIFGFSNVNAAETAEVKTPKDTVGELKENGDIGTGTIDNAKQSEKKKVVILATGGTIAASGDEGKTTGYDPGVISAEELISSVPELKDVADIDAVQICNLNSDDMTDEIWIELANKINEMAKDPDITGFVITHGTDTMEETAYFLNLTVKTDKPVVLTGSMRPPTSLSADGPMNLYEAASVAASDEAYGKGVLIVLSDHIYSARSVTKTSTYSVDAISSGEMGSMGIVRDGRVFIYEEPVKLHTVSTEFDVSDIKELPKVSILYFCVDSDPGLLSYAADNSDGLVIAGAGAGEFSEEYKEIIGSLSIPVVISSRIDDGIIIPDNLLCENTVAADNLSPQKAAILLRLSLLNTTDNEKLQKIFTSY